ncbi:hypothetical protein [Xanthomarina sp.]|nr:hypothetical protein [Xanthomarina sp.]HLV38271.1 hypothetical protein [Xanthomarina sp.]
MKKTGLTIRIDDHLRESIEAAALRENLTVSQYVRELLWDKHGIYM